MALGIRYDATAKERLDLWYMVDIDSKIMCSSISGGGGVRRASKSMR